MENTIRTSRLTNRGYKPSPVLYIICLLFVIIAPVSNVGLAATYYVDPINGSMDNDGSFTSPWRTLEEVFDNGLIQKRGHTSHPALPGFPDTNPDIFTIKNPGTAVVVDGDIIKLRTGYHGELDEIEYYNTDYITIEAEDEHTPTFGHIRFESFYKWILRGLTVNVGLSGVYDGGAVIGVSNHGHYGSCSYIIIENCDVSTVSDESSSQWDANDWLNDASSGIDVDGANNVFRNNAIRNVVMGIISGGDNTLVENNTITQFTADGLRVVAGDNQTWQHNTVKNAKSVGIGHRDGIQIYVPTTMVSGMTISSNTIIEYEDPNQTFASHGMHGIFSGCNKENWTVENNLVVIDHDHGIYLSKVDGMTIINNTVVRPPAGAYLGAPDIKSDEPRSNVIIRNNITYGVPTFDGVGGCEVDHNIDIDSADECYALFTDYDNYDFRLKPTASAVNYGDPENSPISDILGVSRVFPPDAGCYEYAVDPNNQAPVLQEIGDKSVNENTLSIFIVKATDANGDDVANITYSIQNKPSGATFVNQTFSWTPGYDQAETYTVTFIISDGQAQDSETITITVNNVNRPPELNTIGDQSVNENSTLSFSVSASDADGDTISYSLNTLPGGAVFGSETFTWTPGYDQAETYTLTFIASDGQAQDSETITITVSNVNRKPVLVDIGNQSVYTTRALSFAVSAGDPDGDAIDYSASGTPSGASFTNQTFSWTPDAGQNGTYQVTFAASDGQLQDSETITIEVGVDDSSPVVANYSPTDAAAQVPLNNLIILHILDDNSGVDVNSVTIKVNDDVVYTGNTTDYSSAWGHCRRTGTIADFTFVYQADQMFDFDQAINVTVNAADICGNAMVEHSHSFETEMFSFGENKNINADGLSKSYPATVQDSGGNIWAAWHAGATGSRDIYIAKLAAGAGSFAGSIRLTNSAADQCNPAVAIDADDKLYVGWQDNTQGNWDILIRTSADGAAWSAERTVTDSNGNQTNPAIVVDGSLSRNVSVAWQDDRAGNANIYVAVSGSDFVTKTTSQITSHTANQSEPAITADASNTIYVVWTDQRNGSNDIYGASSSIGPWTEVAVVTKSNSQSSPAIAAEQTGSILHLLWADDISGDSDIYYASSDGLPGSPLTGAGIVDDTTGADQSQPAIVVTGSTGSSLKVFASWKDERNVSSNGDSDLYLVQIGSDENVFVGDDGTNSNQSEPALGVGAYGYPYLLWADSRTASPSIYYASTTFVQSAALASTDVAASSGATIGTDPAAISSADDVSVIVPAGACSSDSTITISKVENPPKFNLQRLSVPYDFGPSGIEFSQPVTITIPYTVPADGQYASAYWYNPLTGTLSQQGITNVSSTQISPSLYALSFKTTHFSQFIVGGGTVGSDGVSGGGGCSMSPSGQADLKEYLLPYIALAAVMLVLKLRDARRRRLQSTIRGGR